MRACSPSPHHQGGRVTERKAKESQLCVGLQLGVALQMVATFTAAFFEPQSGPGAAVEGTRPVGPGCVAVRWTC